MAQRRVCVIGLGNVLLGDDGFGPLVIERFRNEFVQEANVEVLDLGTPGLDLTPYLHSRDLVIIADAIQSNQNPGTLSLYGESDFGNRQALLRLS